LLTVLGQSALAAYPERPITMIIAYPPGGGTDLIARALAPYVEKNLGGGAKIVIVNRAGAGGEVGFAALATAPADGYTIVRERLVKAVAVSVADPEFQAKAAQFFAPLRYLAPAEYEALVREADRMYRAMWKEMPGRTNRSGSIGRGRSPIPTNAEPDPRRRP
jgi:tripartite-type tricarboxylate transporter receptor subunit TctC